jgi:hypothetical protein
MTDTVLAKLAALKMTPMPGLKRQWRGLFDKEPPPYNRAYLESRLAYRIQELAYGGLKQETIERLDALADLFEPVAAKRRASSADRPVTGTRLIREWDGVKHSVTVHGDCYEWDGRPYKSLSAVARAITGTRWNGWVFFGLKSQASRP